MAKAKNTGGWFKESLRHRQARLLGKASPSSRVQTLLKEHPSYKNMTYKQLQKKGVFLKYKGDADKDGVANVNDCRRTRRWKASSRNHNDKF